MANCTTNCFLLASIKYHETEPKAVTKANQDKGKTNKIAN